MADFTDNKELLKEIASLKEAVETALDGLKARDKRIEKLEKALLLVFGLNIGHYVNQSPEFLLSKIQTFALEQADILIRECGSTERTIEVFLTTTERRLTELRGRK